MSNLKHYGWNTLNRFGVQIISLIGNVLIARQLTPDDYGLIAMLAIFMGIAWNFTECGFDDCLIRKQDADKKDFSTIFVYNIIVSLILYGILYFTAPFISNYFKRNELTEIIHVLGLTIVLKAITVSEFTRMNKLLMFKNISIVQITSNIFSIVIAFIMALNGYGYWAIVMQTLSLAIINILMLIILNKWRPYLYFSWERYKTMRSFSYNMLLSYLTNQIGQNLYSVFIGKYHSIVGLGYYNQATKINDVSFQGVNSVILTTSYSILSKEKDKHIRREIYLKLLNHFVFIQFAISMFIIGCSRQLMELIFGNKWIPTAPFLQLLTIASLFMPLVTINSNIIKIEGKSVLYRNLTFIRNGLNLISLFLTYQYSIEIILLGQIIAKYLSTSIDVVICGKTINFNGQHQVKIISLQIIAPFIALSLAFSSSINIDQTFFKFSVYLMVFLVVFYLVNKLLHNKTQDYYQDKIVLFLKNKN